MISPPLLIHTYLSIIAISSETTGIAAPIEDLVDEYYTTILKQNDDTIPQDDIDAEAIMKNDRKEEDIAGILLYRDKTRRFAINQRMLTKIVPKITYTRGTAASGSSYTVHYWITDTYRPQRDYNSTYTFMDLCFGLLEDENVVLGQYLKNFFDDKDETWIIIGMVLTKDMEGMIKTYGKKPFKELRKSQRHPFENMLRVWVRHNRDLIETGEFNHDDVVKDANTLKDEHDSGDWHEKKRDQLELILMYKSIKYVRAVITEFESIMGNKTIDSVINDCVQNETKLNHDLADAYSSLARYIKDKYSYIADILFKYSDGSDFWAAWIMCIAVLRPQEWPKVDLVFQKNNGDSLSKFITKKLAKDKVMAEMIAVIVDSNFKPTQFAEKPVQGGQGGSSVPPTLPPVPPTLMAPTPVPAPSTTPP